MYLHAQLDVGRKRRSPVLLAGLLGGILLYVIGSLMDHHERSKRDREERKRWPKDEWGVDKQGSHYPLDGRWK